MGGSDFGVLIGRLSGSLGHLATADAVAVTGVDRLPSAFAVTDVASASIATAGLAVRRLATLSGGRPEAAVTVVPGTSIYQLTEAGVALQATLKGTKFWRDDELN